MISDNTIHIVGAGVCCLDYIVIAPAVNWGDTTYVRDYHVQGGGLVGTALVACARLGAKCDIISCLGDDSVGDEILRELETEKVGFDCVTRIPNGASPFSFIHVDSATGERTIFHRRGSICGDFTSFAAQVVLKADSIIVDDIYVDMALEAARAARTAEIPVVADLTPSEKNYELLKYVDVLIAPRHFARELGYADDPRPALDEIHKLGPSTAIITLGSGGWIYSDRSGRGSGCAYEVDVVDTTGAGDTFHGAFTYGLAKRWDTPRCCDFASAVAAIKCTKPGGRTGLPSLDVVYEFLKHRSKLEW